MKVLTKYFKVALCFMAFALCSFMFAFTPTFTAVQATGVLAANYDVAINALKMPTEKVDYNSTDNNVFKVPLLKNVLGAVSTNYTIRVVDPAGYSHNLNLAEVVEKKDITDSFFTIDNNTLATSSNVIVNAKNDGEYKVIYIVTEGGKTFYSNTYKVSVENVSYELDFTTPKTNGSSKNLIKSKMAVSNENYELPVAYAKLTGKDLEVNSSGEVTDPSTLNEKIKIKVTKDGAPQKENEDNSIFKSVTTDGVTRYYITPSSEGTYTVQYTFEDSVNRPTKTFTIYVEEGYQASELKLATSPTIPKIELGKEITLPELTLNAGEDTNIDYNIDSIKIEKENSNGEIYCELVNNNLTFTMSPEYFEGVDSYEDMVGNYHITYNATGANGKTYTGRFKADGVTVSSEPTIKLAYNFDTAKTYPENSNIFNGVETELKAEYESSTDFVLPAVYVEDPVTTKYEDFKVIRTIRKGSSYYYVDNLKYNEDTNSFEEVASTEKGYNASGDANIGKTNKSVKFKFNSSVATNIIGEYTLEYKVITKSITERESVLYSNGTKEKYKFKVVSSHVETTPTVEILNLKDDSVKNTDDITVKVAATDTLDTRLKSVVFTYSSKKAGATTLAEDVQKIADNILNAIGTERDCHILYDARLIDGIPNEDPTKAIKGLKDYYEGIERFTDSETKNNFNINLTGKTGVVKVAAVAINDDGAVDMDEKELTIKNTEDSSYPVIKIHNLPEKWRDETDALNLKVEEFTVGQGEKIDLPTVYVEDDDKTLSLNVMYYINSPENDHGGIEYLSPTGKEFYYSSSITSSEVQVVNGGSIVTSKKGVYYVAYSATDVAGNTSVMYFTFNVVDSSKPILSVEPVSGDDITISGNTVTGGKGTIIDFETTLKSSDGADDYTKDATISIKIDDEGKNLDYQPSGTGRNAYQFNGYGTYIVTVSGSYQGALATPLVPDSKVIKVVIEKQPIEWLGEFDVPAYASKNDTIQLPDVAASNDAVVKVTYILPGDSSDEAIDAKKVTINGYTYWEFKTDDTSKGTYKVIYTATTNEDVLTKTINIKVGDNVGPTLDLNKGELTQDLIYNGENDIEYVVEVNKSKKTFVVKVVNNGEEVYSYDIGLIISDRDDTGSNNYNISWSKLEYDLTGPNVTKGDTTTTAGTTKTQYTISGNGKYTLTLKSTDSYENESKATKIEFNVVGKTAKKESKDSVVGAVLIVVSLVLLAGVILFFTLTGKKGSKKSAKNQTVSKTTKTKKVKEVATEEVEKVEDEPKSGDVE